MTVHDIPTPSPAPDPVAGDGPGVPRRLAYANAVAVALSTRATATLCAGCAHRPCRCVSVTPAELAALREGISAALTGAERPVLTTGDCQALVAALADGACWRTLAGHALCEHCHTTRASAGRLCAHNRADLDAAAAYGRLARWLASFWRLAPPAPAPARTAMPAPYLED